MGSPFAALVRRKPPNNAGNVPMRTAAELNVRPFVGVNPQEAPEPGAQGGAYGLIPSRRAQYPIVVFRFDEPFQEDYFSFPKQEIQYADHQPHGRQSPFSARTNISVPTHVAYGSLFTADPPTYGMG